VGYARICLNPQFHLQKSILTTDPAFFIWMAVGFFELMPQYMELQLMPIHNSHFSVIRTEKAMSYLSVIFHSTHPTQSLEKMAAQVENWTIMFTIVLHGRTITVILCYGRWDL